MQAPKKRVSKSRKNMRRAHDFIAVSRLSRCSSCGAAIRSHTACTECGNYRGRNYSSAKVKRAEASASTESAS